MSEELNVKVGDFVLYQWGYVHNRVEKIVKVVKITPTGRIRIEGCDEQYDKYGRQMGNKDRWSCGSHIRIPTDDDYKRIKENSAISKALLLISSKNKQNLSYEQAVKIIEILKETNCDN